MTKKTIKHKCESCNNIHHTYEVECDYCHKEISKEFKNDNCVYLTVYENYDSHDSYYFCNWICFFKFIKAFNYYDFDHLDFSYVYPDDLKQIQEYLKFN